MSAAAPPRALDETAPPHTGWQGWWRRAWSAVERRLIALADRANPILVKETRQALKSRQFVVTFLVVLIACWIVSIVGVAMVGPQIYYAAAGGQLLVAYYAVLAFPLALIVPFTAFRSLAAEQEDNTYDLLTITTLTSKQIVTGKLLSSCVQMMVYLCAVSPCIAFTFLLRGVDALTTAFLLALAVLGSLGLSMAALCIGAVARVRYMQMVMSVALVLSLAWVFGGSVVLAQEIIRDTGAGFWRDWEFWLGVAGVMTLYVTTFGMLHAAASAQIAFASENRSTPLRRWMMAQQACFCGWLGGVAYAFGENALVEAVVVGVGVGAAYWYLMGALLTSEWPHLSRRVQRTLPQSSLGRGFLSFLNPGPAMGYMFVVANLTAMVVAGLVMLIVFYTRSRPLWDFETLVYFSILSWSYVVAFLGFGRLLINALRRWTYVPLAAGFLLHIILLLAGVLVPTVVQLSSREMRQGGYSLIHMTNPVWTLGKLVDDGAKSVQADILIIVIPAAAALALILNMRAVAAELGRHRVALPTRVAEEEAELHPPPVPKPTNPWEVTDEIESPSLEGQG